MSSYVVTRIYEVPDMSCEHCKEAISGSLVDLASDVVVDLGAKTVTVRGDVAEGDVISAVEEAGYEVTAVRDP